MFGQMGEEVLLASTRVTPTKLLESGYRFLSFGDAMLIDEPVNARGASARGASAR